MKEIRPKSPVTLEDLLRFKRVEKPDAAFWTQFEQDFRAKQLAAAVERRRWWFGLPRIMPRLVRLSLPVGATAVLALTFVTVRQQPSSQPADAAVALEPFSTDSVVSSEMARPSVFPAELSVPSTETYNTATPLIAAVEPAPASDAEGATARLVAATALDEDAIAARLEPVLTPSARLIAANMAEAEVEFAKMLHRRSSEPRVVEEPLAQIAFPSTTRTSRILPPQMAQLASYSSENERSSQVTERQARRLSEDQFYDAARRLSAQADRLMLKL